MRLSSRTFHLTWRVNINQDRKLISSITTSSLNSFSRHSIMAAAGVDKQQQQQGGASLSGLLLYLLFVGGRAMVAAILPIMMSFLGFHCSLPLIDLL